MSESPQQHPIVEQALQGLRRSRKGETADGERYTVDPISLRRVEESLSDLSDDSQLPGAVKGLVELAYLLHGKFDSEEAADAIMQVAATAAIAVKKQLGANSDLGLGLAAVAETKHNAFKRFSAVCDNWTQDEDPPDGSIPAKPWLLSKLGQNGT